MPPSVTVIVPVRNDAQRLGAALQSILASDYPPEELEILVVDGMSSDDTRELVSAYTCLPGPPVVRLLDNPRLNPAAGMNVGIRQARGEVIVRIDAGTRILPTYLPRCVQALRRTNADNVGGVQRPCPRNTAQTAIGIAMSHPLGTGGAEFRTGRRSGPTSSVYLGCFRRDVFDRIGIFDDSDPLVSEDSDINFRIRAAGGLVYLDSEIEALFEPRNRLTELARLFFRYGQLRAGFVRKHRKLSSGRQLVPITFFVGLIVALGMAPFLYQARVVLFTGMSAYLAVVSAVAVMAARAYRDAWKVAPRVVMAIATIHLAWPAGFLYRIVTRNAPKAWSPS